MNTILHTIVVRALQVLILLGTLWAAVLYLEGRGYDRAKAEDTVAIEQSKREAANKLLHEINKTHATEQALHDFKNTQELADATHQKTTSELSGRLRGLLDAAGRLRDPQAVGCRAGGGSATGSTASAPGVGADDQPEASGLLSEPLAQLLVRITREADDINTAYVSCRADAFAVREGR